MRTLRVTYTLTVDIEPVGMDDDEAERQRAVDMVCDEPQAYLRDGNLEITCEWVET